jgi:hypothetical protein
MANRWAPLAVTDDPKPQRPSKKHPAPAASANTANASNATGVPPAAINTAAAAAFPAPTTRAPPSADFPSLPGAPAPIAQNRAQSGAAAQASQRVAPLIQPKLDPNDANWGYLSSERQKDKVRCSFSKLPFGIDCPGSVAQHGRSFEKRVGGAGTLK